jgi:hypothetical protein
MKQGVRLNITQNTLYKMCSLFAIPTYSEFDEIEYVIYKDGVNNGI